MSVSLCAFRLELGGDSVIPKDFSYLGNERLLDVASEGNITEHSFIVKHLNFKQLWLANEQVLNQKRGCQKLTFGKRNGPADVVGIGRLKVLR